MHHKVILLTALLAAAAPAWAQPAAAPSPQGGSTVAPDAVAPNATTPAMNTPPASHKAVASRPDRYHATLDERIRTMHERLRITPQQEDAWNGFAQVMRDNASDVERDYQKRASTFGTMSAADNLHDYATIEADRAKGVQHLSDAFNDLYGKLSDQQKNTADMMFRHYEMQERATRHAQAKARPQPSAAGQSPSQGSSQAQ